MDTGTALPSNFTINIDEQLDDINESISDYYGCATAFPNCSVFTHLQNQSRVGVNPNSTIDVATRRLMGWLFMILVPTIIIVGLCGNTLSFCVFVFTPLRSLSSSVYLAALAVADSGFLLTLTLTWLDLIKLRWFHNQGVCQLAIYLTYVFSFLSVWYVVSFTVERFLAVGYPLHKHKLCTPRRAKLVVTALAGFAVVAYTFALWTSKVFRAPDGKNHCVVGTEHYSLVTVAGNIDTVVTLFIPFISIVTLNIRIVYVMFREHTPKVVSSAHSGTPTVTNQLLSAGFMTSSQTKQKRRRGHVRQNQAHITRMLVVVSSVFLLLNLPSHAMRMYIFALSILKKQEQFTQNQMLMHQIFQYLYYTNFSVNFFLYSLCGRNFRRSLRRLLQACVQCKGDHLKRQTGTCVSFRWTGNQRLSEPSSDISMKTLTVQLSNTVPFSPDPASV